jgi:cytochrome c551/c552
MGTRNPYRMSVDRKTGYVYWGEVGPDANNDDSLRGPRGYDEINQAKKPGFFGYPMFIANNKPYRRYNYETGESGPYYDVNHPINDSRNNTGLRELPPPTPAFIWYPYAKSPDFPIVGSGGRNAEAGPVYYSEFYPKDTRFPDYYNGKLFIYDWIRGWIMAVTMDKDGNFSKMEKFMPHTKLNAPIDMEMGPDGRLYILEYGNGWFSKNADAGLSRIDFNGGNRPPVADIQVNRLTGGLPFKVNLKAEGSVDPDGDKISYLWNFGNGNTQQTTEPTVEYTYTTPGEYQVTVEVSDDKGAKTKSKSIELYAGNETPDVKIDITGNKMFYFPGKQVRYTVNVSDKEDGSTADGKLDVNNIFVKADYIQGRDKAAAPQGHQIITGAIAGKNIMEVSDCKTCHKPDEKSIGPSFKQIAEKYKNDPSAPETLAKKIISGGSGVWGETAMAAHPGLSVGEAKQLVEYIYSVGGNTPKIASLPVSGSINPTMGGEAKDNGVLYMLASYTDKGGAGIKPITGSATAELVSPVLAAADYSKGDGVSTFTVNNTKFLIPSNAEGWASYNNLDLTEVKGIELSYMVQETPQQGYIVEAFVDDANGTRLGEVTIGPGAAPKIANKVNISFTPVADGKKHNLYFRFKATDPAQKVQLGIVSMTLHP